MGEMEQMLQTCERAALMQLVNQKGRTPFFSFFRSFSIFPIDAPMPPIITTSADSISPTCAESREQCGISSLTALGKSQRID